MKICSPPLFSRSQAVQRPLESRYGILSLQKMASKMDFLLCHWNPIFIQLFLFSSYGPILISRNDNFRFYRPLEAELSILPLVKVALKSDFLLLHWNPIFVQLFSFSSYVAILILRNDNFRFQRPLEAGLSILPLQKLARKSHFLHVLFYANMLHLASFTSKVVFSVH